MAIRIHVGCWQERSGGAPLRRDLVIWDAPISHGNTSSEASSIAHCRCRGAMESESLRYTRDERNYRAVLEHSGRLTGIELLRTRLRFERLWTRWPRWAHLCLDQQPTEVGSLSLSIAVVSQDPQPRSVPLTSHYRCTSTSRTPRMQARIPPIRPAPRSACTSSPSPCRGSSTHPAHPTGRSTPAHRRWGRPDGC